MNQESFNTDYQRLAVCDPRQVYCVAQRIDSQAYEVHLMSNIQVFKMIHFQLSKEYWPDSRIESDEEEYNVKILHGDGIISLCYAFPNIYF